MTDDIKKSNDYKENDAQSYNACQTEEYFEAVFKCEVGIQTAQQILQSKVQTYISRMS